MNVIINFHKIYFSQASKFKYVSLTISIFLIICFSSFLDTDGDIQSIYLTFISGDALQGSSFLQMLRLMLLYLFFIYLFLLSTNPKDHSFIYMMFHRIKSGRVWYQSIIVYAAVLSVLYWLIALIAFSIFLLLTALINGDLSSAYLLFFSRNTLYFFVFSVLTSITLANFCFFISTVTKQANIAFVCIAFLILLYINSFFLVGERHILFFNTSILCLNRINLTLIGPNAILLNVLWQCAQNIIISCLTLLYLNKKGLG